MKILAPLVALLAAALATPAVGADDEAMVEGPAIAFRPAVVRAVDDVIVPAYRTLADHAETEDEAMAALCANPDAPHLAAARDGFRDLVLAWSGVEMFRFGPARDENRYERLFFWPDPRGRGLRQVQGILAKEDPTATDLSSLLDKSVAVQGLFALEFVLFGTGSEALAAGTPDTYACRYGETIAAAIARTTLAISDDWASETGYAALMRDAGPDNPVYRSHGEVTQELIKSCREQVQLDQQLKLAFTVGATPDKAKPKLAPFWRSNLTVPSIRANLAAVVALCGADGIGSVLPEGKTWQAGSLAFEMRSADTALAALVESGAPWEATVTDPHVHDTLRYAQIPLGGAVELLEQGYPAAFGLITGFNSLDGD